MAVFSVFVSLEIATRGFLTHGLWTEKPAARTVVAVALVAMILALAVATWRRGAALLTGAGIGLWASLLIAGVLRPAPGGPLSASVGFVGFALLVPGLLAEWMEGQPHSPPQRSRASERRRPLSA